MKKTLLDSRLPFWITYVSMTGAMRALFRRQAAKAWNCNEDTVRRRIKEIKLRSYEVSFIEKFCKDNNIETKM